LFIRANVLELQGSSLYHVADVMIADFYVLRVGMIYKQRMLIIDGKYNNDDGLSTETMISSAVIIGEEQQP
jgi:cytosine/uracil/thiamine/allantoin permease